LEKPGWGKRNPLGFRGTHRFLQPNSLVACEIRPEKSLGKKEERERESEVSFADFAGAKMPESLLGLLGNAS